MTSSQTEPNPKRRPVGIDLFAGAGGLSLGFEQAGFEVKASIELDPIHCAIHEYNFPHCASICTDASAICGADIRRIANLEDTEIDVVFGGAPCQGFSLIGKRALDDPRNGLLLDFLRLTIELDANYFVFENVKGITVGKHRKLLEELIMAFQQNGYEVADPYRVLNAVSFQVPQDRQRLFLMGAKSGMLLPSYPNAGNSKTTVWDAIGDLPEASEFPELNDSDSMSPAKYGRPSSYAGKLRGILPDSKDYSHPRVWNREALTSSMLTVHTPLSSSRFRETVQGCVEPISRFLKLDPNGICNTLRAGTGSDRGAFTSPRPIHPMTPRCITVREAARLHSYPDWFRFHATKWHGFRQIGNSVPPMMGRAVAAQIVKAMGINPEKPTEALKLGAEFLLTASPSAAARYYRVPEDVAGRRLRTDDYSIPEQLSLVSA